MRKAILMISGLLAAISDTAKESVITAPEIPNVNTYDSKVYGPRINLAMYIPRKHTKQSYRAQQRAKRKQRMRAKN